MTKRVIPHNYYYYYYYLGWRRASEREQRGTPCWQTELNAQRGTPNRALLANGAQSTTWDSEARPFGKLNSKHNYKCIYVYVYVDVGTGMHSQSQGPTKGNA